MLRTIKKTNLIFRFVGQRLLSSSAEFAGQVEVNNGPKISVYTFLLVGNIVNDAAVREFDVYLEITRRSLIPFFVIFKYHSLLNFDFLVDIVSWDKPGERFRFTILYNFLSVALNLRLKILCQTREGVPLESIIDLFESASWLERECWDMHGIYFVNHNNFLRLLTDYGFRGHPLRKDFPLSGFVELFYDDSAAGVVYESVELVQEYRNFQFKSPWSEVVESAPVDEDEEFSLDFDEFTFDEESTESDIDAPGESLSVQPGEVDITASAQGAPAGVNGAKNHKTSTILNATFVGGSLVTAVLIFPGLVLLSKLNLGDAADLLAHSGQPKALSTESWPDFFNRVAQVLRPYFQEPHDLTPDEIPEPEPTPPVKEEVPAPKEEKKADTRWGIAKWIDGRTDEQFTWMVIGVMIVGAVVLRILTQK